MMVVKHKSRLCYSGQKHPSNGGKVSGEEYLLRGIFIPSPVFLSYQELGKVQYLVFSSILSAFGLSVKMRY